MESLTEAIVHFDASLALLDPTSNPVSVRPKRLYRRVKLFGGRKLTGLILDALRRAERPLTTQEVVAAIADGNANAPNAREQIRMALRYLAKRGAVAKEGERQTELGLRYGTRPGPTDHYARERSRRPCACRFGCALGGDQRGSRRGCEAPHSRRNRRRRFPRPCLRRRQRGPSIPPPSPRGACGKARKRPCSTFPRSRERASADLPLTSLAKIAIAAR